MKLEINNRRGIFSRENIHLILAMYLVFFINLIQLFAIKTSYFGRISFILISILGTGLFLKKTYKNFLLDKNRNTLVFFTLNIIFFIYVLINGLVYKDIKRLVYGGYQYIIYTLVFYAIYYFVDKKKVDIFLNYIIGFNIINSFICIYEYVTRKNLIPSDYGQIAFDNVVIYRGRAFFGSFLNAGVVLAITVFISIYYLIKAYNNKNMKLMITYSLSILIFILGIFSTGSRGPLVSLFGGLLFGYIIYSIVISSNRKRNVIILSILFVVAIISLLLILRINTDNIQNSALSFAIHRIQTIFDWSNDPGNVGRIVRWKFGIDLFKQNPVFGIGVAATGAKGLGEFSLGVTESGVIKKLAELGIVGSIIYYAQIFYIGKISFNKITSKNEDIDRKIFILLLLSAIVTVSIEEFIYQALEAEVVAFYFWTYIALIFKSSKDKGLS